MPFEFRLPFAVHLNGKRRTFGFDLANLRIKVSLLRWSSAGKIKTSLGFTLLFQIAGDCEGTQHDPLL